MKDRPHPCPTVTVHYAQTLDGRIATRTGHSQWISCAASLRLAHELRATHDAVLVGVGTAVADDPRLTVRLVPGHSPLRIVVDSTLRIPLDRQVLTDGAAPTLIVTTARAPAERLRAVEACGVEVMIARQDTSERVDLGDLLARLRRRGVRSVLIEGGGAVITSALRGQLVDELVVCIAPKLIGDGIAAVHDLNILRMGDALTFTRSEFEPLDDDIIFRGSPARSSREDRRD